SQTQLEFAGHVLTCGKRKRADLMRIYRGDIGVELSLDDFEQLLENDEKLDAILDIINDVEMDQMMMLSEEEYMMFESELYEEMMLKSKENQDNEDMNTINRVVNFLNKYGKEI